MTDAHQNAPEGLVPDPDPVASMLAVLDLAESDARTTEDIFTGVSQSMPLGRVYGGQVLAQSIVAAERTLLEERTVHSMHGYFLRPGDSTKGITFAVDRIHDGRSFSTRRTQAFQEGVPIFSMIASFQDEDPGLDHQAPMPADMPSPEELPDFEDHLEGLHPCQQASLHRPSGRSPAHPVAHLSERRGRARRRTRRCGCETRRRLPDDPAIHRAALAYISDLTIQESILRAHGVSWATPGLKVASLDHAMWWHRPGRVDEWMLYVQESPSARGGRGLATGRIYSGATARWSRASLRRSWCRVPSVAADPRRVRAWWRLAALAVDDRLAHERRPRGALRGTPTGRASARGVHEHDDRGRAGVEGLRLLSLGRASASRGFGAEPHWGLKTS